MGRSTTMMRSLTLALVALAVANVMALPLAGDEAPNAMFDDNDDDATLMAEMNKAIGRVQMGMSPDDLGESATVDEAEKAELAMQESLPGVMSLLQEAPEDNADQDLGESDEEFSLMSGSDDDVAKQINDQISSQVANQLGSIDTGTGSEDVLEKFEKDKAQAAEFVEAKAAEDAKKKKAKAAAMKALAEAREAMERATMSAEESSEEDLGESAGTN